MRKLKTEDPTPDERYNQRGSPNIYETILAGHPVGGRSLEQRPLAPETDPGMLAGCFRGERGALDEFVLRFNALVYSTVRRVLGQSARDPAVSLEDVTQDVFLKLFRNEAELLRRFDPEKASLPTWIALIARSVALDSFRKRRLKIVPLDEEGVSDPASREPQEAPDFEIPVKLLTGRQKLVLTLLFDRGWDVPRIAEFMRVDEQTVRSTKHKALERLREAMSESHAGAKHEGVSKG